MRSVSLVLLLLFGVRCFDSAGQINDDSPLLINVSIDSENKEILNIELSKKAQDDTNVVTGFKLYYTKNSSLNIEQFKKEWENREVITNENSSKFIIDTKEDAETMIVYRLRATIFFDNIESIPTRIISIKTKTVAAKAPLIVNTKILHNSSVLISFFPSDDVGLIENYTLLYKQEDEPDWKTINFQSDVDGKVLLDGLIPNRTYEVKMYVSGHGSGTPGMVSNCATFATNSTALALIKTNPHNEWTLDPQTSEPLNIKCTVKSVSQATVYWMVNDVKVSVDSSFYTVKTTVHEEVIESTITAKSKTRTAKFTCVASNEAGESSADVHVVIKGPGSPPSEITLIAERGGYTISWKPPSHPNGLVTKYVVYYTLNREDPLSDWKKMDLDGSEKHVRLLMDTEESFYGRVQAATELGPGIISDVVAMERDTQPISVEIELNDNSAEKMVVDPREQLSVQCTARGKPRPSISVAVSDRKNASTVEVDVWHRLQATSSAGVITAMHNFSILTSKFLHCRAKNSAGSNYSSIELKVNKPGDAPTEVQVLSVNALDATVVWENPQFPNLPITVLVFSKNAAEDKSGWLQYESNPKETQTNRMLLQTQNLEKSTEYFVCVRAKNSAGIGPTSVVTSFVTLNGGPDAVPWNVKMLINEANQVIASWEAPNSTTKVTGYSIYYTRDLSLSNEDYKNWQTVEVQADTSSDSQKYKFDHSVGLKPKTFYRVRIAGKNIHADGPASDTTEFETAYSELPIPTDLKTEVMEDNTIHIKFSAVRDPDDHSKAIDKYRIDLAATDDVLHAQWKTILPKSIRTDEFSTMVDVEIDGDSVEKNRMYWVKATARLDNPAWGLHSSKPRWFRTGHGKLITTVKLDGSPLMELEPNLFKVLSTKCTGNGSPAPMIMWEWMNKLIENTTDGWTIQDTTVDENTIVSLITRNNIRESGELTCIGINDEGNATSKVEIRILGPGSPPEDVKLSAYRNQINVTWKEPQLPNGDIMKYIVYYSENGDYDLSDWNKFETTELDTYVECFGPEIKHFVRVQAVSDRGPGIISDVEECFSDFLYEPLSIAITADNILNFEAEPNQNVDIKCKGKGKPLPDLYYTFGNETEQKFEEVEISAYDGETFEGKAPQVNSRQNITVLCRAQNKYETININKKIIIRRPGEAPGNISWSFEEEDDSTLFINWNPIEHPNGEKLEYNLYLSNFKTKVSGPPVRIPDIPLNVNVSLRISAENENGEGEKSFPISIPTPNGGPKTPPILSSLHAQDQKVYISWSPPRLPNGIIQNYTIYLRKDENGVNEDSRWTKIGFHSNYSHAVLGEEHTLEIDERYQMKMSATNQKHEGPMTKVYTFDLVSFDENDVISNFTATVYNSTVVIIVLEPIYQKYNVYIREENSDQPVKHEIDVAEGETRITFPFQLDTSLKYKVKLSGMKFGRESPQSEEIVLDFDSEVPPTSVSPTRRNIVKEPPL